MPRPVPTTQSTTQSIPKSHNTIKDPHRYAVQGSDTTVITKAASLPGQQFKIKKNVEEKIPNFTPSGNGGRSVGGYFTFAFTSCNFSKASTGVSRLMSTASSSVRISSKVAEWASKILS